MIFVSDHAFISKWWWIGAIRKTRRPQYLKQTTWMITESASTTKMPPISSSRSSVLVMIAKPASAPPNAIEPVSPMNTSAGKALYQRKPIEAPISAAARIARSSCEDRALADVAGADVRDHGDRREREQRDDPGARGEAVDPVREVRTVGGARDDQEEEAGSTPS